MPEHVLFLTGHLAAPALKQVLEAMPSANFTWEVRDIGVSVAALMTTKMIHRRLGAVEGIDRIVVPGLCAGDLEELSKSLGVSVERGPEDLRDLPTMFGHARKPPCLDSYRVQIFAEIVEAPTLDVEGIVARAERYKLDGADVIDLGCLPGRPFPHLEDSIKALRGQGFSVSVDSLERNELLRGAGAGADYLLSLHEGTLSLADEVDAVPVLIPKPAGDLQSLYRTAEYLAARGRRFLVDSILDPIHFGFTASIVRYAELRQRLPEVEIMMGIGNLTELTDADTCGINMLLAGIASELDVAAVLTTEVSLRARSAVYEFNQARRICHAARAERALPKGFSNKLYPLHASKPYLDSMEDIEDLAARIRDPSYRIRVTEQGLSIFNRDGLFHGRDPFALFSMLASVQEDAPHAFYVGVELARAEIAWQLGKEYRQDRGLDWGAAIPPSAAAAWPDTGADAAAPDRMLEASRRQQKKSE